MAKRQRSLERDRYHAVIFTGDDGKRQFSCGEYTRPDGTECQGPYLYNDVADAEMDADGFDLGAHASAVEVEIHIVGELRGRKPGRAKHE